MSDRNLRNVRFVVLHGACYMRTEDVANFIRDVASGEDTDVRNRLDQAAASLSKSGALATAPKKEG